MRVFVRATSVFPLPGQKITMKAHMCRKYLALCCTMVKQAEASDDNAQLKWTEESKVKAHFLKESLLFRSGLIMERSSETRPDHWPMVNWGLCSEAIIFQTRNLCQCTARHSSSASARTTHLFAACAAEKEDPGVMFATYPTRHPSHLMI